MELLFRPYYTRWEVAEFLVNLLLDRLRIHLFNGVMFEHPPDLSSDIEYMLQSGQVSLKILSETLVDSWYPIIFQLALSILGNDVEARQVAIDTSVAALLGMHDYSSSTGVQKWLLRYAAHHILSKSKQGTAKGTLPDFRRWFPDRQERKPRNSSENTLEPENDEMKITWGVLASSLIEDRLPTILYYQLNLKIGDIAEILKCEEHTVHFRLQKSRSRLRRELEASGLHNAAIKTGYLERLLRRTCQQHRHDTQLQPNQRTMILLEISRLVNRKQVAQRAHITVQEFSTIALVVLVVAIISWGFSSLLPVPQSLPASQSTGSPVAEQSAAAVKPDRGDLQDQGDIEFPLDSVIHYIVQPGDTLDIVSKRLGTSPLVVKKLNNLPEDVSLLAGQVLELRTANTGGTGKFPVIAPYRSPVLLTAQSPPSLIFQRIQEHDLYYQSMWAEGRVIFYGPAGYSGPPRSSRIQVWSKPGSVLVIAGPPESNPDGVVLSINSSDSSSRKTYLALRSGDRDQWFYSDEEILQRKSPLETLAYPVEALELARRMVQFQPGKILFAPVQTETLSGRNTLVTDIVSQQDGKRGRLWIDRSNGIVLRWQHFTGLQDNIVDWEISLSKVVFDNSIHPDFFKPYYFLPENFAEDQYGLPVKAPEENASSINSRAYAHPELSFPAAPSNFDPADQWLVFQYPNSFNHLAPFSEVEIYSNEYYLGSLVFGNPWTVVCSRAPDGYKIAYATMLDNKTEEAFLNWFDLREPTIKVHNVLGGIAIHELAFSPDSRYLAVAGSYEGIGGIYLADMLTQRVQQLTQLVNAHSLAWSPDNTKLAVITGGEMIGSPEMLLVINIDSGQVVHRSLWNSLDSGSLKESPVMEWGIPYPVQPQGLEECARPPTGNE